MVNDADPITIDGSRGEGGGQVLRSALALSAVTGRPFRITRIRAGRRKSGLLRQHLTAVRAAAVACGATVEGATPGSGELSFEPGPPVRVEDRFSVGTAGSACLVFQTVLPILLVAPGRSRVVFEGGTHNPAAPTFEFLARAFLPIVRRMGAKVDATLERPGFFPAGGGRFVVEVAGGEPLRPLELETRGKVVGRRACVRVANLPDHVGERELRVLRSKLGWRDEEIGIERCDALGPGNVVSIEVEAERVAEVVTSFGALGVKAEVVSRRAVDGVRRYLAADAPVGEHLADQLLLPLALSRGGRFRTVAVTPHCSTNAAVIERFLPVAISFGDGGDGAVAVEVAPR